MRKWVLVAGLTGCCVLFLVSGAFLGYLTSEQKAQEITQEQPKRKPSDGFDKITEPVLGQSPRAYTVSHKSGTRAPSAYAIHEAQKYAGQ